MSTDELLSILKDRGLQVVIDETGSPHLKGDRAAVSTTLLRVLKLECHRQEILNRFRPKLPRRIVLLTADGEIERVLEECEGTGHHERIRQQAKQHPGRTVAGEWRERHDGKERWTRFLIIHYLPPSEATVEP